MYKMYLRLQREEEVSVYSLEYNQKYDFNPMDIIVCLVECSHSSIGQIICVTDTGKVIILLNLFRIVFRFCYLFVVKSLNEQINVIFLLS